MESTSTLFIAIGTIAAALITGFWSFINLIVSKDQKISEFRQVWIDELRNDISLLSGHLSAFDASWLLATHANLGKSAQISATFIGNNLTSIKELAEVSNRVLLRLNPIEHEHLVTTLGDIGRVVGSPSSLSQPDILDNLTKTLLRQGKTVLDQEWKVVKKGETGFRYSRNFSFLMFTCTSAALLLYVFK